MELTILGTGSATALLDRNPSAHILTIENENFLIDCGEGTQYRFLEHKIKGTRIHNIFISHLHGDHYFGLIGLLSSWSLNQRKDDLNIFAPKGLGEILMIQFKYSGTFLNFKINFIEIDTTQEKIILDHPLVTVETIPLQHRIECAGFLFREKVKERSIIKNKLPQNFPVAYIKQLKAGEDATDLITGEIYKFEEYTTISKEQKTFAYCSDTMYDELKISQLQDIDVLYHEATFNNEHQQRAIDTRHSTAQEAAIIAKKANVKKLVIGHFSSRYKIAELAILLAEAKNIFPKSYLAEEGMKIEI